MIGALANDSERCDTVSSIGGAIYVSSLSEISMAAALLTFGLVRPWGEVFPAWMPYVGGRAVPVRTVTIAAITEATIVAALTAYFLLNRLFDFVEAKALPPGCAAPDFGILVY